MTNVSVRELKPRFRSIPEGGKRLGVGLSKTYEIIAAGFLKPISIGRRRLLSDQEIDALADKIEHGEVDLSHLKTPHGKAA